MRATGWVGNQSYGIRVGASNRRLYFQPSWLSVVVEIDNTFHEFPLSQSFWRSCPEFRGKAIAEWFSKKGIAPWRKHHPPEFELTPLTGNRFRLAHLA
jgi:hypothetical protein